MSSGLRWLYLAGLFVGAGAVIAVGCSDNATKKVPFVAGEAGEAGEAAGGTSAGTAGIGAGGAVVTPEGGASGDSAVSEGGAAGATMAPEGGAAGQGEAGAAGAAGSGSLACTPVGNATGVAFESENRQTACRGALVVTNFTANSADDTFSCCGASDGYDVSVNGLVNNRVQTISGQFSVIVPSDAPSGAQSIAVTCSGGVATYTFDLDVTVAEAAPVVEKTNSPITADADLRISGSNLSGVTTVLAIRVDDPTITAECTVNTVASTDSVLVCSFGGDIPVGDYALTIGKDCGFAVNSPALRVNPPSL